jgi:DNA invertase Pin-like site-specific DNA recombinase
VTKLDRLAWSVVHVGRILERIIDAGASLRVLSLGLDTSNATGKLMLNVLGSVAQFKREMMAEHQREGIAKAAAAGKYKGAMKRFSDKRLHELQAEWLNVAQLAKRLGVTRQAVYKRLTEGGCAQAVVARPRTGK